MALDRNGQTAAHLACEHRNANCLQAVLDSAGPGTVDLEARNFDGKHQLGGMDWNLYGVLGVTSTRQKYDLMEPACLLGLTALHVAVNTECHEAVKLLLERGADIDAVVSMSRPEGVEPGGTWVGLVGGRGL